MFDALLLIDRMVFIEDSVGSIRDSGRMTGNPHLTRRWPSGRVTEGLPTIQAL